MNSPTLTTQQLLDAVKRKTAHLSVDDGRIGDTITERTVRYYVTIGVVRPPLRDGNTSVWTNDHVNDLIRVRRAQHNGEPLKAIRRQIELESQQTSSVDVWKLANNAAIRFPVAQMRSLSLDDTRFTTSEFLTDVQSPRGWLVRLSPHLHLGGFGAAITEDELDAVREALRERISADLANNKNDNINPDNKDNQ